LAHNFRNRPYATRAQIHAGESRRPDPDGETAQNPDLSRRRAASVRDILAKQFSINASRLDTDGKGESEPIDKNDRPAEKANNWRVEFIRR
jgi:OmpA-OmpF porin, OOP family